MVSHLPYKEISIITRGTLGLEGTIVLLRDRKSAVLNILVYKASFSDQERSRTINSLLNCYREYTPRVSEKAEPLHRLKMKDAGLEWILAFVNSY